MGGKKVHKPGDRAHWTNKHQGRIVNTTYGRNGQPVYHREVTAPCTRCFVPHTFIMTSKPHKYCPACIPIVKEEKRIRDINREREARLARALAPPEPPRRRLIPYAGAPRAGVKDDW